MQRKKKVFSSKQEEKKISINVIALLNERVNCWAKVITFTASSVFTTCLSVSWMSQYVFIIICTENFLMIRRKIKLKYWLFVRVWVYACWHPHKKCYCRFPDMKLWWQHKRHINHFPFLCSWLWKSFLIKKNFVVEIFSS